MKLAPDPENCGRVTHFGRLAIAALSFPLLAGCEQNTYVAPPPPKVEVANPLQRPITRYLEATGNYPINDYISAGDAPAFFFHGTSDPTVPFSWATSNVTAMHDHRLIVGIRTFDGAGHSLFGAYRDTIHEQADYFLYFMMDLARAAR